MNSLTALYWRIGKRIHEEVLRQQRASYGEEIVATPPREQLHRRLQGATETARERVPRIENDD